MKQQRMRARTSLPARTHTHTHTCCLVTSSRVGHHLWTMKWSRAVCGSSRPPAVDATAPGWPNDGIGFRNSHLPGSRRHHPVVNHHYHHHHSSRQDFICPSTVDTADTYICCAYSPRCFIIQKVKPTGQTAEEITPKDNTVCREIPSPLTNQDDGICDVASNVREVLSPLEDTAGEVGVGNGDVTVRRRDSIDAEGDTISKPEVVFPAMEDTPEITASFPSEATSSTAAITLPTVDSLAFPGQSHVDAYPSSLGQVEGTENNGNCGEKAIPLPELKAMLRQQLEYYFSRENLATDAYLLSQMDSDQYVPISTIAKFNQIRRLTEDINLIVEVLRESALVQVDDAGEKVRPNPRSYVLILREIPETTPMKELEDLFSGENCPKFSRLEFAHNNSWYVLFESDEDTHKAYRYLREEAKTFKGKPIMARIKARLMTSVPFPHSFKNGICTPSDADGYSSPQLTQQTHVQYTYTNVPNEGFNNQQQVCPPFYPPTMLQAWAPTTPACVDLGTVFSMNGLSPQAAFRPLNNSTNRHNYSSRDRQMKTYNPQQNYNFPRTEQTRYFNRGQSTSYLQRQQQQQQQQQQQHSYHNLMNTAGTCGFDYMAYSSGSRNLHSFGMDLSFYTAPNLFFRRPQGPSSVYPAPTSQSRHNPVLLARNQMGLSAINGQDQNYLTVGGGVLPFAKDSVLSVAAGAGKQCSDSQTKEPWVPSQRPRSRRWWKENGTSNSSKSVNLVENSNGLFTDKSLGGGDVKPESPKFDLETTSFPPLPGCLDTDVLGVDVYESRLSDIVKGTVKPTTRDSKTQTSESALSPCAVMKDSSTLTIEEAAVPPNIADGAFTPPTSPVVLENVSSEENDITADKMENDKSEEQQHGAAGDSSNCSNLCSSSVTVSPIANATATFSTPHTPPTTSVVASSTISSLNTTSTATTIVVATSTSLMTCLDTSSHSDALINVPNNVEIKHTPPKLPKSKQVDTLPKMKSTDLPSPKSKSVDLVTSKNKLDTPKEKAPAVNKHKSSCISISKQLESSLVKERSTDMSLINNKIEVSVLKNSDVFPPKEKQVQPHMSKTRTLDSSASKTKSLESDPPPSMLSVNGHMDSESTPSSEDEKPFRKLTYSEVAMRAKEKVEKLAQELKEKERQEALVRHHRQQEMASQNKLAATRGPFRDFPKGRIADQQRSGYREWRERRKMARAVSLPTAGQ